MCVEFRPALSAHGSHGSHILYFGSMHGVLVQGIQFNRIRSRVRISTLEMTNIQHRAHSPHRSHKAKTTPSHRGGTKYNN